MQAQHKVNGGMEWKVITKTHLQDKGKLKINTGLIQADPG